MTNEALRVAASGRPRAESAPTGRTTQTWAGTLRQQLVLSHGEHGVLDRLVVGPAGEEAPVREHLEAAPHVRELGAPCPLGEPKLARSLPHETVNVGVDPLGTGTTTGCCWAGGHSARSGW